MKDYKLKKLAKQNFIISRFAYLDQDIRSFPIKDIKTNKFNSEAPNLDRMYLKISQRPRNKPSMPKMPWD